MDPPQPSFSLADYLVLAAVLLISSLIGLYYRLSGGRQKTDREYLVADRGASVLPVAFSLMASFMSAITLLGVSMENYSHGTQFIMINLSYLLSTPIAAYIFLPVFYHLQSASVYKYLEQRFGAVARLLASLAFTVQMTLYMGIVVYAPALALSAVTGIHFTGAVVSIGLVCTLYSALGGMKAVLMTDVFQSLLMFAAIYTIIVCACIDADGLLPILETAWDRGRVEFLNLSPDPTVRHTLWTQMVGGCFVYCSLYAVNQAQVQRLLSLPSLRAGQAALWLQVPILMLLSCSTSLAGLCIFHHYRDCDPISAGRIRQGDQLLPLYIVERMSSVPGLAGLAVAGIFSGSLSTVSSAINSLAAVTLEDYIRPCCGNMSDSKVAVLVQVLTLIFGAACVGLAFLADLLGTGVLQASLTIFGVVGGPLLGLFTLGVIFRRVEQRGAVVGFISGLCIVAWIGFGGPKPPRSKLPVSVANCSLGLVEGGDRPLHTPLDTMMANMTVAGTPPTEEEEYFYLYRISYAWTSAIGFFVCVVVGVVVSECVRLAAPRTPLLLDTSLLARVARPRHTSHQHQLKLTQIQ